MSGVIRLDPQILEHRKFIRAVRLAGSAAVHLWLGLRAWAQQHPDNGFIPEDMVGESRGPKRARDRQKALQALLDSELLEKVHGGVVIHDILDWADSAEKVEEQREKWRRNKRAQRSRSPDSAAKPEPSGDQAATKRRPNTNQTRTRISKKTATRRECPQWTVHGVQKVSGTCPRTTVTVTVTV